MSKKALKLQVSLLRRFTKVALGIENQGINYSSGDEVFFIEEEMALLKVHLGENHPMYKKTASLKETIDLKIADNKDPALFY